MVDRSSAAPTPRTRDPFNMAAHWGGETAKFGWYMALRALTDARAARLARNQAHRGDTRADRSAAASSTPSSTSPSSTGPSSAPPTAASASEAGQTNKDPTSQAGAQGAPEQRRAAPGQRELLRALARFRMQDARMVGEGLAAPAEPLAEGVARHVSRVRAMLADLPRALERHQDRDATSAKQEAGAEGLPDYFTQDFHFQDGGYLSERSAQLYDVQVDTLFLGSANAMRRAALRPIADVMAGRDQRQVKLLDVACGTGRFLREVRRQYPAMQLTGIDLSQPYLDEAARHMEGLRHVRLQAGNGEALPFEDASQDIVTTIFLFHELPPQVRRTVAGEMARVLKPGGRMIFIDSLQRGDEPGWDGMLEAFPVRFHEPYYRSYLIDDLHAVFEEAGLRVTATWNAFLSKVIVCDKP
ncbi:MAG: class I SAM-dependent methyltransferase [Pseudomonadota bacterium]